MRDPHEILGVSPGASEEDIKRAYKRMAMEWHPDRHGGSKEAEERFKEVNAAYQILTGKAGRGQGPSSPNASPFEGMDEEILEFLGDNGFFQFGDMFAPFIHQAQARIRLLMLVTLEEAYAGGLRAVRFSRPDRCQACAGLGREIRPGACPACGGAGRLSTSASTVFRIMMPCQACSGSGKALGGACGACRGARTTTTSHETIVDIPPGVRNGETVVAADGSSVAVRYAEHPTIRIVAETLDTESEVETDLFDLVLGGEAAVVTLAGEMRVKIEPGLKPGSRLRIRGAGMIDRRGARGDHMVRVWARMPRLTEAQRKALGEIRAQIGEQQT
jgi:molecular chaperone DnaJ